MTTVTFRTATEASAVTAIALGVSLGFTGAYIPAGISIVLGIALFGIYEFLGIENVKLDEDDIEELVEEWENHLDDAVEGDFDEVSDELVVFLNENLEEILQFIDENLEGDENE